MTDFKGELEDLLEKYTSRAVFPKHAADPFITHESYRCDVCGMNASDPIDIEHSTSCLAGKIQELLLT